MGDALTKAPLPTPAWGYSKDDAKIFEDGKLPKGYYPNPAMVPGSDAEKQYRADAERDGAIVPWDPPTAAPASPQSAAAAQTNSDKAK